MYYTCGKARRGRRGQVTRPTAQTAPHARVVFYSFRLAAAGPDRKHVTSTGGSSHAAGQCDDDDEASGRRHLRRWA